MNKALSEPIKSAVKSIGEASFPLLLKALIDGPPKGAIVAEAWLHSSSSRKATKTEQAQADYLASVIHDYAELAIFSLFLQSDFIKALSQDGARGWVKRQAKKRSEERTDPFVRVIANSPPMSEKALLKSMEKAGVIEDIGASYRIIASGKKILKSSMPAKISRIKKQLRNT